MAFFFRLILLAAFYLEYVYAQIGCCSVWWYAPTGAVITHLESTLEIPAVSTGPGVHFVWPGMEPRNGSFVFQNVIGDDQPKGNWVFATWYGPYDVQGDYYEYGIVPVAQGDGLTTIFDLNLNNGEWNDPWHLNPSVKGVEAGEKSRSGGVNVAFPNQGAFTDVIFEIELQAGATWDFGSVTWTNILMEVNSTDTSWCIGGSLGNYKMDFTTTLPQVSVDGTKSTCYIEKMVFVKP